MLNRISRGCRRNLLLAGILGLLGASAFADPTISSFAPAFGSSTDPNYIHIYGSGFYPGTVVVKFNGWQDFAAGATSDNEILAHVPAGTPLGSGPIYVSVNGVFTYSLQDFTVIGSGPYISGFTPNKGGAGASVLITGAHFYYPLTVRFNGQPVTVPSGSSDQSFTVTVPPGVTTGLISVSNSAGIWTTSSNFYGPPVITGFWPTNGRAGTNVVISGTNFTSASAVKFGGIPAASFTVLSNNAIQAVAPVGVTNGLIWVTTPHGQISTENLALRNFVVLPSFTSFNPTFGSPGTNITITGANLNEGSGAGGAPVVQFNGVPAASVSGVTFNQLTAVVPNGATTGFISVTTTNGSVTNSSLFYLPPKITGFTPNTNPPGTRIKITGTNFIGTSAVTFANDVSAPNFTVTNNNTLGVEVPPGIQTGFLTVTGPAGTSTSLTLYYAAPQISGFTPSHGLPGDIVTITGTSFQGASAVRFAGAAGAIDAQILTSNPTSLINVLVPTNAITGPITVVAPAGTAVSTTNFVLDYASDLLVTVTNTPNPVTVTSNLTYAIQVRNLGPFAATGVLLSNTLPAGVVLNGPPTVTTGSWTTNGSLITASFGTLNSNATATLTVVVKPQNQPVMLTNIARAGTDLSDPIPANNTVTNLTYVEPFPLLSVAFNPPLQVKISWSGALSNYTLQFKTNLATNFTWANVSGAPILVGGSNVVTETNSGPAKYYRLKR